MPKSSAGSRLRLAFLGLAGAVAAAWIGLAAQAASGGASVSPSVADRAARGEPVEVLILLDDAAEELQLHSAVGRPAAFARMGQAEYENAVATRSMLLGALKSNLLLAAADPDVELLTDYANLPILHARLRSARALANLRRHAKIKSIDAIVVTRASLAQSLPLIRQPEAQAAGQGGSGTTVAVLDSGVDYRRAAFGSCTSPGGDCKVVVARDFATQDNALDANGHGSNVAAIVLGVAPQARIAALDVFESSGTASSNVIIEAINWCIANKAAYNIVAINMSLGGGRQTAAVAPVDAWGTAIANAVKAGIVVVAAAGNDGSSNALALPAAYSNVVSVGAVYDAALGPMGWGPCTDTSTAARQVACFSNSASFLTLFAPGSPITAADLTHSGTSQAAPHVAGAVAVLRADRPGDSVAQIVDRLKLGATVTDRRNGIAKPALDLMASLAIPPRTQRLSVSRAGSGAGSVTGGPSSGIDCGSSCAGDVETGSGVTLTALHGPASMFGGWTGACAGSAVSCSVTMSAARSVTANFVARSSEDFLAGGVVPAAWTQPPGSAAAWASTTGSAYVGGYSLQAGGVGNGQSSVVSVSGNFAAGTISFARRVSADAGDGLRFYIDDQLQGSWSGEVAWGMVAFPVSAGAHVLAWAYAKDGSGSGGSDSAWIDSVNLPLAATTRREARNDFNGDGRADILWRHGTSGRTALWLMDGPIQSSGSGASAQVADLNWQIVGSGDFNGDGKADILWRHAVSGLNSIWFMDGTARLADTGAIPQVADLAWKVVGSGDFNGDGKADILWRNASSGQNAIWFMDGLNRLAGTGATAATTDLDWRVVGVADFDGDGKADILWRHAGNGQNAVWLMDGLTRRTDSASLAQVADQAWKVVGSGDFDGDGKADILWRHAGNGQNSIWFMNGCTRIRSAALAAVTDLNWKLAGVGDFNGDGKADILWRHSGSGQNAVWLLDGATRLAGTGAIQELTDLQWKVVSPRANPN